MADIKLAITEGLEDEIVIAEKVVLDSKFNTKSNIMHDNAVECVAVINGTPVSVPCGKSVDFANGKKVPRNANVEIYLYRALNTLGCVGTQVKTAEYVIRTSWSCTFRIDDVARLVAYINANGGKLTDYTVADTLRKNGDLKNILDREIKKKLAEVPAEDLTMYTGDIGRALLERGGDSLMELGINVISFTSNNMNVAQI